MKRRKLERLIVEIIEDREALIAEMEQHRDTPSDAFTPLDDLTWRSVPTTATPWAWSNGSTITIRCTCPPNRGDNYAGSCPVHDVTYS